MSDALKVLTEVKTTADLESLHPLRLHRWHRALLGLPDPVYMQYGCTRLLEQVRQAAAALRAMVDLLGLEGLPVAPQVLAQRTIQTFRWYVPSGHRDDLVEFQASWDKESSSWKLTCPDEEPGTIKSVPGLEFAFEKSQTWAGELTAPEEFDENAPDVE